MGVAGLPMEKVRVAALPVEGDFAGLEWVRVARLPVEGAVDGLVVKGVVDSLLRKYALTVIREIFVVRKFSYARLCTKIKCAKNLIAVYKYTRYYGKGSSVRKLFDTKI